MPRLNATVAATLGTIAMFAPAAARAHFRLTAPASWMSQDSTGGPQKDGPCAAKGGTFGDPVGTPTNMITSVPASRMVSVSVTATVPHPGWYQISLHQGNSASQTLTTLPDPPQTVAQCTPAMM